LNITKKADKIVFGFFRILAMEIRLIFDGRTKKSHGNHHFYFLQPR